MPSTHEVLMQALVSQTESIALTKTLQRFAVNQDEKLVLAQLLKKQEHVRTLLRNKATETKPTHDLRHDKGQEEAAKHITSPIQAVKPKQP